MRPRTDYTAAVTVFAAAFVVRLVFCFVVYPYVAADFGAGDGYDVIARNLARGGGYVLAGREASAERLPLYPLLLAGIAAVFGTAAWPWQLAQAAAGALTCALLFVTASRFAGRAGALVAAAFCAIHPALILYTARPLTETLYVLLVVLFLHELTRGDRRFARAGVLLGLQLSTKSTAFLHLPALLASAGQGRGGALLRAGAYAAVILAPWALWNLVNFGVTNLTSATGGIALYHGTYISRHVGWTTPADDLNLDAELALRADLARRGITPAADIRVRDAAAGELAAAWIRDHPGTSLRLWIRNLVLTWYLGRSRLSMAVYVFLHGVLLTAAAVGAFRLWTEMPGARRAVIVTLVLIGAYTGFHAAVQPAVRYILPAVPCAALLAAAAFRPRRLG